MTTRWLRGLLLGVLAAAAGCGSEDETDACQTGDGYICAKDLGGFPFVHDAVTTSDYCAAVSETCTSVAPPPGATTVALKRPEANKLCLSGWMAKDGWALVALEFSRWNADKTAVLDPLDAAARGITQMAFTIDSLPNQGVSLIGHAVRRDSCPESPLDCVYPPGFDYGQLATPGPVTAPLTDFTSDADPSVGIDPTRVSAMIFQIDGTTSGDYAFCLSGFKLLDAAGHEVTP